MIMILLFQDEQEWLSRLHGGVPDGTMRFQTNVSAKWEEALKKKSLWNNHHQDH